MNSIITKKFLIKNGGTILAVKYKTFIDKLKSVNIALSMYNNIYTQINKLYLEGIGKISKNDSENNAHFITRREIDKFFFIADGNDVCSLWQKLDNEGKNLFNEIEYEKLYRVFPYIIRFFDNFYEIDLNKMKKKINTLVTQDDPVKYVRNLTCRNPMIIIKDGEMSSEKTTDYDTFVTMDKFFRTKYNPIRMINRYSRFQATKTQMDKVKNEITGNNDDDENK